MADYKAPTSTVTPRKLTFKEKFRKHWYWHALNFVVGTIVISMLLNYVMLPKIAQSDVNKSELLTVNQTVTNPRPDVVHIVMNNKVINKSLFTPTIDSFNASLFLENTEPDIKPFGYITIPSVHALKEVYTQVDQEMQIADMEQFIAYNKLVTSSKTFRVAVRGKTRLHLGALPVCTVHYNKAIEMNGLNGLAGLYVKNVNISVANFPDGSNMHGTVVIPNASVMNLTIGDMVQDLYVDGQRIGNTTIKNVILAPGSNEFNVTSNTNQTAVIGLIGPKNKYKDGKLPIEARTISVTYNGEPLAYFTEAMKASPVTFTMDLAGPLRAIKLGAFLGDAPPSVSNSTSSSSSSSAAAAPVAHD